MSEETEVGKMFRAMADVIDRNGDSFGGAVMIVPPDDPTKAIRRVIVDGAADPMMFWTNIKSIAEMKLIELQDEARKQQSGWR